MINLSDLKKINKEVTKAAVSIGQSVENIIRERAITFLDDETTNRRIDTCHKCPLYANSRCTACGCVVAIKAAVKEFRCPLGKWNPELLPREWTIDPSVLSIVPQPYHRDGNMVYAYSKDNQGIMRHITDLDTNKMEVIRI